MHIIRWDILHTFHGGHVSEDHVTDAEFHCTWTSDPEQRFDTCDSPKLFRKSADWPLSDIGSSFVSLGSECILIAILLSKAADTI